MTKNYTIFDEQNEIQRLHSVVDKYVNNRGLSNVAKELYFYIWVYDNKGNRKEKLEQWLNTKSGRNLQNKLEPSKRLDRLEYLLSNLKNDASIFHEQHDYLCLFVKGLDLLDISEIPKRNIYSCSSLREYEPAKNAKNMLKHGISFRDLTDNHNCCFGDLITHTNSNGEDRNIYFSRIVVDGDIKYVMSICKFPERDFEQKPDIPPLRIISARYFTEDNYEEVIKQAIKDENLDEAVLNGLRELAIETIERINQF